MTSAAAEDSALRNVSSTSAATLPSSSSTAAVRYCYSCHSSSHLIQFPNTSAAAPLPCPRCSQLNLTPVRSVSSPPQPPSPPSSPPPSSPWPPPNSEYSSNTSVSYETSDESDSDSEDDDSDSDSDLSDLDSFLASLPIKSFHPNPDLPLPSCSICMEDFEIDPDASGTVNELPCGHYFHNNCIVEWLQRRKTCPLCRYKLRRRTTQGTIQGEAEHDAHLVVDLTSSTESASSGGDGEESLGSTSAASSSPDNQISSANGGVASADALTAFILVDSVTL